MSFQVIITPEFQRSVERQVRPMMDRFLTETKAEMIKEFNAPKSGRQYPRRNRASAPGEPPARQTGTLQASISEPKVGREGRFLVGVLFIAAPYAGYLERGTPRMAPRPFARAAVEEVLRRLR
jgi:HK97 gp10 family phage protein